MAAKKGTAMVLTKSTMAAISQVKAALAGYQSILHLITDDFQQVVAVLQKAYFQEDIQQAPASLQGGNGMTYQNLQDLSNDELPKWLGEKAVLYLRPNEEDELYTEDLRKLLRYQEQCSMARYNRSSKPQCCIVLFGCTLHIPSVLEPHVARVEFPPLEQNDFAMLLADRTGHKAAKLTQLANWYAQQMPGFSELEVLTIFDRICYGAKGSDRLFDTKIADPIIWEEKAKRLKIHGKLELVSAKQNGVGMATLNAWLDSHKANIIRTDVTDSDLLTKGILLLGLPGTGKSIAAESCSRKLGLPLVKLPMSNVLDMYQGNSEKNIDQIQDDLLRYCAPCVLWLDEVEKLFGSVGKENNGVMDRIFGKMLEFLSGMDRPVFTVATANDVTMPREFFRPGRFSQLFSLMLPSYKECVEIMESKLKKHLQIEDKQLAEQLMAICGNLEGNTQSYARFCTGADINELVKELSMQLGMHSGKNYKNDAAFRNAACQAMREVVKYGRFTVDSRTPDTLLHAAKSYRMVLEKSAQSANSSEPLFSLAHYHPRQADAAGQEGWNYFKRMPECVSMEQDRYSNLHTYDRWMFHWIGNTLDIILSEK